MRHVRTLLRGCHPHRFRRALPHLPERGGRHARGPVELAQGHAAPPLAHVVRGIPKDLTAHLVGEVDRLGRAGQVALIGEHVRGRGDVAHHGRRPLVGPEVLRRDGIERGAKLFGRAVHLSRREADPRLHERELGVYRRRLAKAIDLGQGGAVVPRGDVGIHHGAVRAERRRLGADPVPGGRQRLGAGAPDGGGGGGAVQQGATVRPLGDGEGVRRHQRVDGTPHRGGAQHRLYVVVRERVVGIERQGALERSDRLGPLRRLRGPGGVVEPGLAQTVPRVGVGRVAGDELLVGRARVHVFAVEKRAVGIDDGAVVRGQIARVGPNVVSIRMARCSSRSAPARSQLLSCSIPLR